MNRKRIGAFLLALLMLLGLCACTSKPGPEPTDKVVTETPSPTEDPIEKLLAEDEECLLLAARRATAQAFDRLWYDCSPGGALLEEYYLTEAQEVDSALIQRVKLLAAVKVEADRLKQEDGKVLYLALLPQGGGWVDQWVELELDETDRPSKTVTEGFITATLENDRVFLSFADTEEANYYLRGWGDPDYDYQEEGRAWEMPGDALPVGPDHRYEVEGLFSRYKDLFIGDLSGYYGYRPYLFLVTEDNGLEMVDITTCFQYGFFCAMPLPGRFDAASLSAPVMQDEFGQNTVLVTGSGGEACDLSWYAAYAGIAVPLGDWSGSVVEITGIDGSWSRIANLTFENSMAMAWGDFTITELDEEILGGDMEVTTLGMTADGIVSAFKWNTWNGEGSDFWWDGADCGAMVWTFGVEATEYGALEIFRMTQLTGASPLCRAGETVKLYRCEFGATGVMNEAVAPFEGEWMDTISNRCHLSVTASGPADEAHIRVEWGDSATETYVWTMTGTPSRYEAALYYDDCTCRIVEYGENGTEMVKETLYTEGSGSLFVGDVDTLCWEDMNFDRSKECRFIPANGAG